MSGDFSVDRTQRAQPAAPTPKKQNLVELAATAAVLNSPEYGDLQDILEKKDVLGKKGSIQYEGKTYTSKNLNEFVEVLVNKVNKHIKGQTLEDAQAIAKIVRDTIKDLADVRRGPAHVYTP